VRDKKDFIATLRTDSQKCSSREAVFERIDTETSSKPEKIVTGFHLCYKDKIPYYFSVGKNVCFLTFNNVIFSARFDSGRDRWLCATPEGVSRMKFYSEDEIVLENDIRLTGKQFIYGTGTTPRTLWGKYLLIKQTKK
jgi:hypothetical protein